MLESFRNNGNIYTSIWEYRVGKLFYWILTQIFCFRLMIHLFSLAVPLIMMMYLIYMTFLMFIPIMGRSGSSLNPDLIIGYKAASMTLATLSFICPLFMVLKKPPAVITTLYMTTILSVILVVTTRLGFPYSGQLGYEVSNFRVQN